MIKTFEIENFRTFRHLKLTDLARVNLIAGANNVGKTALIEALWKHSAQANPTIWTRLSNFRGINQIHAQDFMLDLFHKYDASVPIKLVATGDWGIR